MELRPSEYWAIEKVKFSKHCRAIQHLWEEGKSSPVGLPPATESPARRERHSLRSQAQSLQAGICQFRAVQADWLVVLWGGGQAEELQAEQTTEPSTPQPHVLPSSPERPAEVTVVVSGRPIQAMLFPPPPGPGRSSPYESQSLALPERGRCLYHGRRGTEGGGHCDWHRGTEVWHRLWFTWQWEAQKLKEGGEIPGCRICYCPLKCPQKALRLFCVSVLVQKPCIPKRGNFVIVTLTGENGNPIQLDMVYGFISHKYLAWGTESCATYGCSNCLSLCMQ